MFASASKRNLLSQESDKVDTERSASEAMKAVFMGKTVDG